MKIKSLEIKDHHPIKLLKIDNLGNTVIIAGANGSGKTRLKQAIIQTFQGSPVMDLEINATRSAEEDTRYFNGKSISVKKGIVNQTLQNYINSRIAGGTYVGSIVQIDSNRNIQTIRYSTPNYFGGDPDDQQQPLNFYLSAFSNRWQEFMTNIFQKVAARKKNLADEVEKDPSKTGHQIAEQYPDPMIKYKNIFSDLLPGKELQDIDPGQPGEFKYKNSAGQVLPFSTLSSGEQEVVKVLFDFARKEIRDSIVIVDEPELHLHPTLTFKLIEALKSIGNYSNQFFFLTHSVDLISTYYTTGNVYFIDAVQTGQNQAHRLSDLDHTHSQLVQIIGQNLGIFAVGKKLIFVEGESSSVDRLTYHTIAQKYLPEARVISAGSVSNILALNQIEEQIKNSVFGIDFYMIRDRDGLDEGQIQNLEKNGRIKCLKKRHIENYFLDAEILFKVAERLYITATKPNLSVNFIDDQILKIAQESINFNLLKNTKEYLQLNHFFKVPTVKSIETKSSAEIKKELQDGIDSALSTLSASLREDSFKAWIDSEDIRLSECMKVSTWKDEFHGKIIFSSLCSKVFDESPIRIRQAYLDIAISEKPEVFQDIIDIITSFD